MLRFTFIFIFFLPQIFSLTQTINESQEILFNEDSVSLKVQGNVNFSNITSQIYDINLKENSDFLINLEYEKNSTNFKYLIKTTIPQSYYNKYELEGITFLEYTTLFDIQTNRELSLIKYKRFYNQTYSPREIEIKVKNPTNYSQTYLIDLIKTRPNQANEFRNQLYLKTQKEIELNPNQENSFKYLDSLSEIGDSYFAQYNVLTHPKITRLIQTNKKYSKKSYNSGSFSTLLKDIIIEKFVSPKTFAKGDEITITIKLSNPNGFSLNHINLEEKIQNGFTLKQNSDLDSFNQTLHFLPFETKEIKYTLIYNGDNEIEIIPGTSLKQGSREIQTNPITLYIIKNNPKILIEKIITPQDKAYIVQILIKNIGDIKLKEFELYDSNLSFYIPNLEIDEEHKIQYKIENPSFREPTINEDIDLTSSLIINDKLSTTHSSKSNQNYYTIALIILAGALLVSDIVL